MMLDIIQFHNISSQSSNALKIVPHEDMLYISEPKYLEALIHHLTSQVDDFRSLEENWDGYGGIRPFEEIVEKTKSFLFQLDTSSLTRISYIFPLPHGTIKIIWENTFGESISLEIGRNTFSYILYLNSAKPKPIDGKDIHSITSELSSDISKLFGKNIPQVFH